ncbi:MAG: MFS transporter, partial [Clostridia bacterium]|nr:MFS transporter [Clostridia bacterium]
MGSIGDALRRNPMINTLVTLEGNPRACLFTEPLWGIPYNLYLPFVSVYMAGLGMTAIQIGTVTTVFLASQMVFAIFSGIIADKLGRRLCTLIFDVLSWSVPSFLWMLARDYRWFIVAALFNGAWRVTETSWGLLMIEDAPDEKLVHLFSLTQIAGLIAGFFAPIAYFFVREYSVMATMRVLYGITFTLMTTKFVLLYFITKETGVGKRRMAECRGVRILPRLWDSRKVLVQMLKSGKTMCCVGLIACYTGACNVSNTFWSL